jgi:hypothetical protein
MTDHIKSQSRGLQTSEFLLLFVKLVFHQNRPGLAPGLVLLKSCHGGGADHSIGYFNTVNLTSESMLIDSLMVVIHNSESASIDSLVRSTE